MSLRKLAKLIFQLTRYEVWLGGKANYRGPGENWPRSVESPGWDSDRIYWTLSPEISLGGHKMRVCVSSQEETLGHAVRVFVDGKVKYPGGRYHKTDWFWIPSWSGRVASTERNDGGQVGPVDTRDLVIKEAKQRLRGPVTSTEPEKPKRKEFLDESDPVARAAILEVEAALSKSRG